MLLAPSLAPAASGFDSPGGSWAPPVKFETGSTYAAVPVVAVADNGRAAAVWIQVDGGQDRVWGDTFDPKGGWATPVLLSNNDLGSVSPPQVAIDAQGNALAVWGQVDGGNVDLRSSEFIVGWGWGPDVLGYSSPTFYGDTLRLAMNGQGSAVAVFLEGGALVLDIQRVRHTLGGPWSSRVMVSGGTRNCNTPDVGIDATGAAVFVWAEDDGVQYSAAGNREVAGSPMGTPVPLETTDAGVAFIPRVAVAVDGTAFAIWRQHDGVIESAWSARFTVAGNWESARPLEQLDSAAAASEQIAVGKGGQAVAVWWWDDGTTIDIQAAIYALGTGWSTPVTLDQADGRGFFPDVAIDGEGTAYVVWQHTGRNTVDVQAAIHRQGGNWTRAAIIDTDYEGEAVRPQVGAAGPAGAIVVWAQFNATSSGSVWSSRFVPTDTVAPALAVWTPTAGAAVTSPSVRVTGSSEPSATVTVNGVNAPLMADGSFSLVVALATGANVLTVTSTDASGNTATLTRSVTFEDPILALQGQLAAANANATAAQAGLATTQASLVAAQSQLAQAQADAAAARASANTTQAQLTSTQAQLAATQATVNTTRNSSSSTVAGSDPLVIGLVAAVAAGAAGLAGGLMGGRIAISRSGTQTPMAPPPEGGKPPQFQGGRVP